MLWNLEGGWLYYFGSKICVILTLVALLGPGRGVITRFDTDEANEVMAAALASGFWDLRNHEGRGILAQSRRLR